MLDITQWAERYAQWRHTFGIGLLSCIPVAVLIAVLVDFIGFRVLAPQLSRDRVARVLSGVVVALVSALALAALFLTTEGFWLGKPPAITPVIEKGYGVTSLSCGDDDITKDGWHSCTALKDRRLLDLRIDKGKNHVTVYDRDTGERLDTK